MPNHAGGIIRTQRDREHPYKTMNTEAAHNNDLSLEARGLLFYLFSKPDHWETRFTDLLAHSGPNCKEDRLRRILGELERAGYIKRERIHVAHGRFEWVTTIYESPIAIPVKSANGKAPADPSTVTSDTISVKPAYGTTSPFTIPGQPAYIVNSESSSLLRKEEEGSRPPAPSRKEKPPKEEKASTPNQIFGALAEACKINRRMATGKQLGQLRDAAAAIWRGEAARGRSPDQVAADVPYVLQDYKTYDWRGKKGETPDPIRIQEHWEQAIDRRKQEQAQRESRYTRSEGLPTPEEQRATASFLVNGWHNRERK